MEPHEEPKAVNMGCYRMSASIGHLAAALAVAQGKLRAAAKDSENPHFRSRYADLASAWEACRDALSENGISVVQIPSSTDAGSVTVSTILLHKSGENIAGDLTLPVERKNAQGAGSAITYARRYALMAFVGIAPDDDDDGNAACLSQQKPAPIHQHRKPSPSPQVPAPPQEPLFNKSDPNDVARIKGYFEHKDYPVDLWDKVIENMHDKPKRLVDATMKTVLECVE